ncbi:MAG: putative peptidoglycan glycosyltransferase FtsW [Eubacterium sp.]
MKKGKLDKLFVIALLVLVGIGILMVFSASMYSESLNSKGKGYMLFLKQFGFVAFGIGVMFVMSKVDYRKYNNSKMSFWLMIITFVLLGCVLIPGIGVKVNDARRWISIFGVTSFQPSELAKVSGILYLSCLLAKRPDVFKNQKDFFLECMIPIAVLCGITAVEPSLSAAMAIGFGMVSVLYFGGVKLKTFMPYAIVGVVAIIGFFIIEPWRIERFNVFLGKGTVDYQISQSLLAIGTGGIFGQGLGNGKQKLLFLPELQNDFIFANIGEEFGLIGCLIVLGLFAFIIWRGFKIAKASPDRFGYLYTGSVMFLLGFQVFINVGVATSVIPVTGMALPFVSAGGTSVIVLFAMLGPILSLSREVDISRKKKENSGDKK